MATTTRAKASRRSGVDATPAGAEITARTRACARRRVALEAPAPEVDAGRFPARRILGDMLLAEVDAFADGHDRFAGVVRWRHASVRRWR
ncbi:MAG: alpha,4-glucan--maltose-phosphate maltosyltransferase [Thermoleophilia bacterium]|nr:alpha,4-glucan--maltose-phosphate maltosyltransferase [Thermoleophilia bacterium]